MVTCIANGSVLVQQDSILLDKNTGKKIETTSFFEYEGPSPNQKPATVHVDGKGAADGASGEVAAVVAVKNTRRDLSGVWTRERTHNVDSYVGMGHFMINYGHSPPLMCRVQVHREPASCSGRWQPPWPWCTR